jgi:hypothetical protein
MHHAFYCCKKYVTNRRDTITVEYLPDLRKNVIVQMGPNMEEIVNFSNPVFRSYLYNSSVLVAKVLALSFYTVFERFRLMVSYNLF